MRVCSGLTSMTPASSVTLLPLLVVELPPPPPAPAPRFVMDVDNVRRNVGRRRRDFLLPVPVYVMLSLMWEGKEKSRIVLMP